MTRIIFLLTLIVTALAGLPAHAQQRVFVASFGLDTNPCNVTQPCRTFQHAHDIAPANAEIDVLDPAGYGPVVITKGISIQAHGFGGITQTAGCPTCAAITVSITTPNNPVTLNGLLLDGGGTGTLGIYITSSASVQILNSVVRHFQFGIYDQTSTLGSNLLIQDTIASDNLMAGIALAPIGGTVIATLSRTTANNNSDGVVVASGRTTIANSVMSNNSTHGLVCNGLVWLAKNVISGNDIGVNVGSGTTRSYGDNYINDNLTLPVSGGSLTPAGMQ
jgi:hypothetical protein